MEQKIIDFVSYHGSTHLLGIRTTLDTRVGETDMDSLDLCELAFDLEKEFGFKCSDKEWKSLFNDDPSVRNIIEFVKSKI